MIDLRGLKYIDPIAQYRQHNSDIQLMIADPKPGDEGLKYTIGCHPAGSQPNLRPLIEKFQLAETRAWIKAEQNHPEGNWGVEKQFLAHLSTMGLESYQKKQLKSFKDI